MKTRRLKHVKRRVAKSKARRVGGKSRKQRTRRQRGAGLSDIMPITTWGEWRSLPGSTAWGPGGVNAPPPLANGGLYTGAQSTGDWASRPFPATQYALAAESARVSGLPEVFYHQRPTTNVGNSWSPYVGQAISPQHWSARMPSL